MLTTPRAHRSRILALTFLVLSLASARVWAASEKIMTLTSAGEPGELLTVSGIVFHADGTTPAPGVALYIYHADARGYYSEATTDASNPRLKATFETDSAGRYAFNTIKPGGYPGSTIPSHIHYQLSAEGYPEQRVELRFVGDPRLSAEAIERSRQAGRFGTIQPLEGDADRGWRCVRDIRLRTE